MTEKKETRGRPRFGQSARKRRNVNIDDADAETLAGLGGGNLSEGLHRAADLVRSMQKNQ